MVPLFRLFTAAFVWFAALSLSAFSTEVTRVRQDHMGVQVHFEQGWDLERTLPLIAELGVGWIREDFDWKLYERAPGNYALPERTRRWIDAAHEAGLKIIIIFNTSRDGNPAYPKKPFDPDAYARAAAHLAKELAGKVQVIEVLNEPNNFGFSRHYGGAWNGWDGKGNEAPWIAAYVELLNKAASAIKKANPDIKVIGLGSPAPANFRMIAHGIAPEVDGITDHPYSLRTVPEIIPFASSKGLMERDGIATADERGSFASQIRKYRDYSARYNGPREIWLTEWGFSTYQESKEQQHMVAGVTLEAQAKYALRRFSECLGLGVEMSLYYDFKDDGKSAYEAEANFGLVTYDLNPKPAYDAVQRLARFMVQWQAAKQPPYINAFVYSSRPDQWPITWDGSRLASTGTVISYAFEPASGIATDKGSLMVLFWSSERAGGDLQPRLGDLEIGWPAARPAPSSVRRYDLWTGQWSETKFERKSGRLWFPQNTIPDSPVALIIE